MSGIIFRWHACYGYIRFTKCRPVFCFLVLLGHVCQAQSKECHLLIETGIYFCANKRFVVCTVYCVLQNNC